MHGSESGLVSCADFKSVGSRGNPAPVGSIPTRFRQLAGVDSSSNLPHRGEVAMKKLILIIAVLAVAWVGLNYLRTGEFTLSPSTQSEAERRIADLEDELAQIKSQIAQAGRTASMSGVDTTADVESLMKRQEALEKAIAEARKRLP